eukprot:8975106-Alexandrium_andersonii.AAC.1
MLAHVAGDHRADAVRFAMEDIARTHGTREGVPEAGAVGRDRHLGELASPVGCLRGLGGGPRGIARMR